MRKDLLTFISIGSLALSSCATNRSKTLLLMGGASIAAGTIGAFVAPRDESAVMHAGLWAASAAALSGGAGLFLFDEQAARTAAESRAASLDEELNKLRKQLQPALLSESTAPIEKALPGKLQGLVRPGSWKIYRMDQWVENGENRLIHQDQMVELIPATLSPGNFNPTGNP